MRTVVRGLAFVGVVSLGCAVGDQANGGSPGLGGGDVGGMASTSDGGPSTIGGASGSGGDESGPGTISAGDATTTGAPEVDACTDVLLFEDFSGGDLDASRNWETGGSGNAEATVVAATLEIGADNTGGNGGFWAAEADIALPARGAVSMALLQGPDASGGLVWLGLLDDGEEVYIDVFEGELRATFRDPGDDGFSVAASMPYVPAEHAYLRLALDATVPSVIAQTSPDAMAWTDLASFDLAGFDLPTAVISIGGALTAEVELSPFAVIDDILLCAIP